MILTAYLYVTLGAVILMKAAVLHTHGIHSALWGIAIVKALLLAKFMLIGNGLKLGERYKDRPLIWPTLHKAAAFLVLLVILTSLEEVVVGLFHGLSISASLGDLFGRRLEETLAGFLIMLLNSDSVLRFPRPERSDRRRPAAESFLCRWRGACGE